MGLRSCTGGVKVSTLPGKLEVSISISESGNPFSINNCCIYLELTFV